MVYTNQLLLLVPLVLATGHQGQRKRDNVSSWGKLNLAKTHTRRKQAVAHARMVPNLAGTLPMLGLVMGRCQRENRVWWLAGLYGGGSLYLSYLARKLPIRTKTLSLERRLRRFWDNPAVRVRDGHHSTALWLLRSAANGRAIHLVMDRPKVRFDYRLLMVGIAHPRLRFLFQPT